MKIIIPTNSGQKSQYSGRGMYILHMGVGEVVSLKSQLWVRSKVSPGVCACNQTHCNARLHNTVFI